jgi:MFS family permease
VPATSSHDTPQRAFAALFTSSAVSTTGFLTITTANSLVAEDLTGSATLAGVPAAAAILGTALGANLLAHAIERSTPRNGLIAGYALATLAAVVATLAVLGGSFWLFVVSMVAFGVGYGSNRLARYVAADLFPPDRRGRVIGWIVWASTIGAAAGPMLVAPSARAAALAGLTRLSGAYIVCTAALALSAFTLLLSRNAAYRPWHHPPPASAESRVASALEFLRHPGARHATLTMVTGQFVMVLIMTMTPVHARLTGSDLTAIGIIISAHTLGMYALSPLTGLVGDRYGRGPVILGGIALLVLSAIGGMLTGPGRHLLLVGALLVLGVGWNLGFVTGSALLTDSVPPELRVRAQGFVDGLVWGFGALASLVSGPLLQAWSFVTLCALGAALGLLPLLTARSAAAHRGGGDQIAPGRSPLPASRVTG